MPLAAIRQPAFGLSALVAFLVCLAGTALAQGVTITRLQQAALADDAAGSRVLGVNALLAGTETIVTGKGARLEAALPDGAVLSLGEKTEFQLGSLRSDKGAAMKLLTGAFRLATGALASPEKPLRVETPLGTLGIRGTDFWGGVLTPGEVDVLCIAGGPVDVTAGGATVSLGPGQGTTLRANQPPGPAKTWPREKVNRATAMTSR